VCMSMIVQVYLPSFIYILRKIYDEMGWTEYRMFVLTVRMSRLRDNALQQFAYGTLATRYTYSVYNTYLSPPIKNLQIYNTNEIIIMNYNDYDAVYV